MQFWFSVNVIFTVLQPKLIFVLISFTAMHWTGPFALTSDLEKISPKPLLHYCFPLFREGFSLFCVLLGFRGSSPRQGVICLVFAGVFLAKTTAVKEKKIKTFAEKKTRFFD